MKQKTVNNKKSKKSMTECNIHIDPSAKIRAEEANTFPHDSFGIYNPNTNKSGKIKIYINRVAMENIKRKRTASMHEYK